MEITKSDIWYEDGSVVLQAEETQFRVHTSRLSAKSTVFKDMFDIAQSPANTESHAYGCPLVHLPDDTADDWALLLDVLYDYRCVAVIR